MTPPEVTAPLIEEWGKIAIDVSADAARHVPADWHYIGALGIDGLALPWGDRSYCNPEFVNLRAWLDKAEREAASGNRLAVLAPARGNRRWYRRARTVAGIYIEFDPLTFWSPHPETGVLGPYTHRAKQTGKLQVSAFPAPIELLCYNWTPTPERWAEIGDIRVCRCT